jgi:hypothetical protein
MNQWIFLIDGYGMKLEGFDNQSLRGSAGDSSKPGNTEEKKDQGKLSKTSDKQEDDFKTFIVRFIGN